ncbi:thioesterase II family protein [Paracidovorax anthurii]|uniref:Thioesterase component of yersiniabactin synthetase n=1 Tax=Paracidovorax anthurii TaxID=78229 RepID=A0A328Z8S0_9BURK|nr:alpha/beta fold hydrolase [Paracidovorax anthurii]RAR82269.1 thioesterase component of yersiniabactin synthetase [Paracidovorax anthurii]
MTPGSMLRTIVSVPEPAALHVVLCPFAGGSGGAFRSWHGIEDAGVHVSLAIYPGRDHRLREACATDIGALARQLVEALSAAGIEPDQAILAGHSMGAQVAFEACALLERRGEHPAGLVLSGCHAPHLRGRRLLSPLDDTAFLTQLVDIGGCSPELLSDPALLALFLPMLRADFRATEDYGRADSPDRQRLRTPALLIYGSSDEEAHRSEVAAWAHWLRDAEGPVAIAGDHFYATRRPRAFLGHIARRFASLATSIHAR